jgi:hypothetical protein
MADNVSTTILSMRFEVLAKVRNNKITVLMLILLFNDGAACFLRILFNDGVSNSDYTDVE